MDHRPGKNPQSLLLVVPPPLTTQENENGKAVANTADCGGAWRRSARPVTYSHICTLLLFKYSREEVSTLKWPTQA